MKEKEKEQAQKQARTEDEIYRARHGNEDMAGTNPANPIRPGDDNTRRNFEFGTMINQTGAEAYKNEDFTGLDTEMAEEITEGAEEKNTEANPKHRNHENK